MNLRLILLLLILLAAIGFRVISSSGVSVIPFERELEDRTGRAMKVLVLSKKGEEIIIEKLATREEFVVNMANLSEKDQKFLSKLDDKSDFDMLKKKIQRKLTSRTRSAVWRRDIVNAQREAEQNSIPVLLVFLHSQDEESGRFDRDALDSKEFRTWANGNVVLCRYYNDPSWVVRRQFGTKTDDSRIEVFRNGELQPNTSGGLSKFGGLNGLEAQEGRKLASEYGVGDAPVVLLLSDTGKERDRFHASAGTSAKELEDWVYKRIYPKRVEIEMSFFEKLTQFVEQLITRRATEE